MALKKLGLAYFPMVADIELAAGDQLVRVSAVHRDNYRIHTGDKEIVAEITGRLLGSAASPLDFPAVGDWVRVQLFDDDSLGIIHEVLPRRSVLKRKVAGKKIDFQLIAANLDGAFIMQSLDGNFNLRRLERYLVMVYEADITPTVLLSKCDLVSEKTLAEKISSIHQILPDVEIIAFSNLTRTGIDAVTARLAPQRTYCLIGSSGVGKSTLLNLLLQREVFATRPVREKDDRGMHTTTQRQLMLLDSGALVIDTPGMRELGQIAVEDGIEETFTEIARLAQDCRFSDCMHENEKGCAILAALRDGQIAPQRYESFMKLRRESAYHARSYVEHRRRDKAFGKMIKAIMKDNVKK